MSKHRRKEQNRGLLPSLRPGRQALVLTGAISFLILRILQFLIAGRYPATYPDSGTYRVDANEWLNFSLVSAQARPTLLTLFYAVLPNDPARVFAQWAIGTVAWLLLLTGVALLFQRLWVALFATVAVWTIGLTFTTVQWDGTILSEPLSITTFVLGLALFVWWWLTKRMLFLILGIVAFGLTALNRPNLWLLLPAAILIILLLTRRFRLRTGQVVTLVILASALLVAALVQQRSNDQNFSGGAGLNRIGWSYTSMLSDESPLASSLIPSLIRSGIPNCMIPQKPFVSEEGPINIVVGLQESCPKGVAWVNQKFLTWYAGFLVARPIETLSALGDLVGPSSQALPYGFDSKVEPPPALRGLFNIDDAGSAWTLITLSLTAAGVGFITLGRRRVSSAVIGLLVFELALIASWALGVLLQVWDINRTIVTNVIGINLIAILLIASIIDSFPVKKSEPV